MQGCVGWVGCSLSHIYIYILKKKQKLRLDKSYTKILFGKEMSHRCPHPLVERAVMRHEGKMSVALSLGPTRLSQKEMRIYLHYNFWHLDKEENRKGNIKFS